MPLALKILLLAIALGAAVLAGTRHARRKEHPHYVHHSIGFIVVAMIAGASLLLFGPT